MSLDRFVIIANEYDSEADALADYEAVRALYSELGLVDTYDAAVVTRKPDGRVDIVKRTEMPTRQGAARGGLWGLAVGAIAALFPGVGLAVGLAGGAAAGVGLGAVAGHVAGGMRRSDLKDLGELLDEGSSGLVVVAATDVAARVDAAVTRAKKRAKANLQSDADVLKRLIDAA